MSSLGHEVIGIDVDASKVAALSAGMPPFFEPDFAELLAGEVASGRLRFSTDLQDARGSHVHFVAVGTPQRPDGSVDLTFVDAAVQALESVLADGDLVVGKSTVPVGTAARLADLVEARGARLIWNPEFLREGFAVADTLEPDRLVYGSRPGDAESIEVLDLVYATILARGTPRILTDFATAELVKVAANSFLATKISFINAMAEIAEVTGADVTQLADAIGHDPRIGRRFLNAGVGFGGGCLPKDIRGFVARAEELGVGESVTFLRHVDAINLRRRQRVVTLAQEVLGADLAGARIGVLGLAFKPDSDDIRDSPALDIATRLMGLGAHVTATDPHAIEPARVRNPEIEYRDTVDDAVAGADLVIVLTEWAQYRALDPATLGPLVTAKVVIDGRNCLDPAVWRAAGWRYLGLGR